MKTLVWHVYGLPVTLLHRLPSASRLKTGPAIPIARLAHSGSLSNAQLSTCVPAMNDLESVDENTSAADAGELTEADLETLRDYADAMSADDFIPLGIAGLQDSICGCSQTH